MAFLPSVSLAPAELSDDDLPGPVCPNDPGDDLGSVDCRGSDARGSVISNNQQNVIETNLSARLFGPLVNRDRVPGCHPELMASRFEDCVHTVPSNATNSHEPEIASRFDQHVASDSAGSRDREVPMLEIRIPRLLKSK
jgi:hypothetical protein